jgi:cyclophilin family peptidyl-prolyl cis-trans isomerase
MKVNKKRVQNMYKVFTIVILVVLAGCSNADPETTDLLTTHYPELYEAVFARDAEAILEYAGSDQPQIAEQAWKAMISTPVDDIDGLIDQVAEANTRAAWASLWFKELEEADVERLHEMWQNQSDVRTGIATVLGFHGNMDSFEMLLNAVEKDQETALAIGRLSASLEITPEQEQQVVELAFGAADPFTTQSYLYGFSRSLKDLAPDTEQLMLNLWETYYPEDSDPIQSLIRILMKNHTDEALFHFELDDFEWMDTQLAIEVARGIGRNPLTKQSSVVLNALLDNRNVNVRIEALRAIQRKQEELDGRHDRAVLNKLGLIRGYEAPLRLEALNSITNPGKYSDLVYELAGDDPYLQTLKYSITKKFLSDEEFLANLKEDLDSENRLNRFFALQELAGWWGELEDKSSGLTSEVKELTQQQMKTADRSMIYSMGSLFRDSTIITNSEYPLMEEMLDRFRLPEDVEVFQAVSSVLKARFEEEATSYIEVLAAEGNAALNQTMRNQGWDIPESEGPSVTFREPDWKRLSWLGKDPVLVLETDKGVIKIVMDVLSAPATISGMDSLLQARAYNGVPFHRVVSNFVIQGGDVETQDGFGGPDYVVPTEATPIHYFRGKVGIASAGTDTEGSQYFIMHDWMPHLTARYTIVGEVYEGMEAVDRIVVGDIVKRAYWD